MGNNTTMVIVMLGISMFAMLFALSTYAIDPCSPYLFANFIYNNASVFNEKLSGQGSYICSDGSLRYSSYVFGNNLQTEIPIRQTTGDSSSGTGTTPSFQFPDWLYSGYTWLKTPLMVGAFIINLVGAPYTIISSFGNGSVAAIVGIFFSILNLIILVNWILGKDN
jgi:hypothetical protein